jgi:crotonobetainyl-CoA:carnitine CoA-transferase CaiB-like acyl-CoA transferase
VGNALLSGIRVLDLTNVLAGPYCTYQLALLGAEVVKVEVPGHGDLARQLGPDAELNAANLGASFLAQNAGKLSIELDLKDELGRRRFEELVRVADVVVENFRAGVLARLGFSWARLRELNPHLVYCSISGYGQDGPLSQAPAYDQVIQGQSGMMSITGTTESGPLRVGFPVCDTIGGMAAAFAICAALIRRERTGEGARLDISMLEAALSAMGWPLTNYLVSGVEPVAMGDQNATAAPSGTFRTADGLLNIAANKQSQFETLCRLTGREDLIADPRFCDRERRKANRAELNHEVDRALATKDAAAWEQILSAGGVPAARILTVGEAIHSPQIIHRRFLAQVAFPQHVDRQLTVTGSPAQVDGSPVFPSSAPPELGVDNHRIESIVARWAERGFQSDAVGADEEAVVTP